MDLEHSLAKYHASNVGVIGSPQARLAQSSQSLQLRYFQPVVGGLDAGGLFLSKTDL